MTFKQVHIEVTDSTNRYCRTLADEGEDGNVVVTADFQTGGRGCGTNSWESEHGKNLLFSILLHTESVPAASQFILSMANALALKDTLDDYAAGIRIKWPNDIYWKDRKICGTLIENSLQGGHIRYCIAGTGLNVNQTTFRSDAPNPVSLCQILGHEVNREEVLQKVLDNTSRYMDMAVAGDWELIRSRYRKHLYRRGETHRFRFADGKEKVCELVTVTDDGHLELRHDNKETWRLAFKEVQFII